MQINSLMRTELEIDNDIWVNRAELISSLKLYKAACGETPWLIGGQSEQTWTNLPLEVKSNICSDKEQLDLLLH